MADFELALPALGLPDELHARRCMEDCAFEERLVGVIMKASGTLPMDMYSLEHVLRFLAFDTTNDGGPQSEMDARRMEIAYIPPERLAAWVTEVLGDEELADAIVAETSKIEDPNIYPPRMRIMRELVSARVLQCYELLGIDPSASEADAESGTAGEAAPDGLPAGK